MLTSQARETLRGVETRDRRRGARRRRHEARRAPGALARAPRRAARAGRSSGSASRRRSGRSRRSAASSPATGRSSSSTPARARSSTSRSSSRSRTCASSAPRTSSPSRSSTDGVEMDSGYEANARSIWPSIYPAILELVQEHRSTIVFVNNRRLAERLALRLNELAEEEIARAHHGSLAREQRVMIEEELKAGRIPCLVATSQPRARHRHGRRRPRDPGRVAEVGRARPAADRPRRPRARRRPRRAGSSRSSAPTCSSRRSSRARCAAARSRRR